MKVGLRLNGYAIGIDPADHNNNVYSNREHVNSWEFIDLQPLGNAHFSARFVAADRYLTMTPTGLLESRPTAESPGEWEQFYATAQPDGTSLLYRVAVTGGRVVPIVLSIEEAL